MQTLAQLKCLLEHAIAGAKIEIVSGSIPTQQASLLVNREHGRAIATFLRNEPDLHFDYASNVTGVDWPDKISREKTRVKKIVDGIEKEIEEMVERKTPGYLEAVYHLYSVALKHGPLVIRLRTENRTDKVSLPSFVPIWRSCEFQEREIFDLFGIVFEGHPDLRRLLMWDGFADHPMRKDYIEPDDYEYEPTPHDDVLEKARRHYPPEAIA